MHDFVSMGTTLLTRLIRGVLVTAALLWIAAGPVPLVAASCAAEGAVMSCCDCPSAPSPCCKMTAPPRSSPSLITASAATHATTAVATSIEPATAATTTARHRSATAPHDRSSPPLFIAHAALLI